MGSPSSRSSRALVAGIFLGAAAVEALRWWLRRRAGRAAPLEIKPSTIRLMTRLAIKHGATNLSQGFPNEPPPREMVLSAAGALIAGESLETARAMAAQLSADAALAPTAKDMLSQYSFPFGTPHLRAALSAYYASWYPNVPADADANVTVVLGATEGFAVCLRAMCAPGDVVAFFQPFHELYPSQCRIWGLTPRAITLHEADGGWAYDAAELEAALRGATLLLFNSPHNPTGKVFSRAELAQLAALCVKHDVRVVTDEIYEHLCYDGTEHLSLAALPSMAERTCVVNALSKTAKATGWRVGWVLSPERYTPSIRAVHDQLVLQAPTPLQFGAAELLQQGRAKGSQTFAHIAAEYVPKRELLMDALRAAGFTMRAGTPQGAYYIFAGYRAIPALGHLEPTEACMKLIEEYGVACVPGDNFYLGDAEKRAIGGQYLRFTFVRSLDVLQEAAAKLRKLRP